MKYFRHENLYPFECWGLGGLLQIKTYRHTDVPGCLFAVSQRMTLVWFKYRRGTYCLTPASMLFLNPVEELCTDGRYHRIPRPTVYTSFSDVILTVHPR